MRPLLVAVLFLVALAPIALADQVAVVVDRGHGAEEDGEALAKEAAALITIFRDRGLDAHLYVYGTRPSGRIRAAELKGDPTKALVTASTREGWMFEGPTDPRHALHTAVRRNRDDEALLVFLVGPFEGDETVDEEEAAEALATWNVRAPVGSRAFAVGMEPERRALVLKAEGWVGDATFVFGVGEVTAEAAPYSPLADAPLTAQVRVPVQKLRIGNGSAAPLLVARSARPGDRLLFLTAADGDTTLVSVERPDPAHRVATLSFEKPDDSSVLWFVEVPEPKTFQWTELAPDARFESPNAPQVLPFEVRSGKAGTRYERTYRIVRSRTDPAPTWIQAVQGAAPPEGLDVKIGPESTRDEHTLFREVTVSYVPKAARPIDVEGTLRLSSEAFEKTFEIPFRIEVPPGRVMVRLETPTEPLPLPPGEDDKTWVIAIEAENDNLPSHVRVRAVFEGGEGAAGWYAATLTSRGGVGVTWNLAEPVDLRVGAAYDLDLRMAEGHRTVGAAMRLELVNQDGVEGKTAGQGRAYGRDPKMVIENHAYAYRVEDKRVIGDPPLIVRLDADGGGGAWLRSLREMPPTVRSHPDGPVEWSLRRVDADRWALEGTGTWRGERGNTFTARVEESELSIEWGERPAPRDFRLEIHVPPRWGSAGWILVGLIGLAVLLALWGVTQLRPAALEGTLLYTVEGRDRAVGRLDLAPAGRRAVAVRADSGGRLQLGGAGDAIAMLRATRVGGLLVTAGEDAPREYLLVDGLTVRAGAHRLRYVSGRPGDSAPPTVQVPEEELLGPEFDMTSGRIDALGGADEEEERSQE